MALSDPYTQELITSLTQVGLAPGSTQLIPKSFQPTIKLLIKYGNLEVLHGNYVKTSETTTAPSLALESVDANPSQTYLLILIDPDAPTPEDPKFAYWRHWVVSGLRFPSTSGNSGILNLDIPVHAEYLGPGKKEADATPHRYLFLLFKEPGDFAISKEDIGGEEFVQRRSWKVEEFVEKYDLELVGVNWFRGVGDGWQA